MTVLTVKNPVINQVIYEFESSDNKFINNVYEKAKQSSEIIRDLPIYKRVQEISKLQEYIVNNKESIIDRIVEETGKTKTDALTSEILATLDVIDYYKKTATKILSDKNVHTPLLLMGKKSKIYYEPLGTILVISPWNYPFYQAVVPFVSAFLAGNSVIYKPSELTPLKGLLEEMLEKTNFLKDSFQIVYGDKNTGKQLIENKPDKIFFTGSVEAGKKIMEQASKHLIPVELELGGKDVMIVFDDIDLERTVNGAIWGALTNSGQSCTSVEKLFIHEEIYPIFVKKLEEKVNKLTNKTQDKRDNGDIDIGFMTAEFQIEKIESQIKDAISKGAKIICGGARENKSMFFPPTVITNINEEMSLYNEETFGPIIPVIKFSDEKEVIKLANNTEFGLSASVWTKDLDKADRVARKLKVGNVSINNVMITEGNAALPFGGVKSSGFGRYKGEEGLISFSNIKSIVVDTQSSKIEANWYPYNTDKYNMFIKLIDSLFSKKSSLVKTAINGLKLEKISSKRKI
jgi:acyl-CoA reductase-like NAD-dependent aldehyde dehydrogenase